MNLEILYEDNHLIVIYKPYGILAQGDISGDLNVVDLVKKYLKEKYQKPGNVYIGLLHRLDRNTEGLMVLAKTSKAAMRLSKDISLHNFEKRYIALVEGNLAGQGCFRDFLAKDEKNKISYASSSGKEAILEYQSLFNNDLYSICEINLKTGRFHQIRCQFSLRGHPLYGDIKYGSSHTYDKPFLQAYYLSFTHPVTKEKMIFKKIDTQNKFKDIARLEICN